MPIGANTVPGSAINLIAHAIAGCTAGAARTDSSGGCAAGGSGSDVALGANAKVNAAQNNQAAQLFRLAQAAASFAQTG